MHASSLIPTVADVKSQPSLSTDPDVRGKARVTVQDHTQAARSRLSTG